MGAGAANGAGAAIGVPYELETLEAPAPEPPGDAEPRALLDAARAEADAIRAAARAEGHAEGRELGLAEARAELSSAVAALTSAAAALEALRDEVAERSEAAAVELALRLAEKVVAGALAVEPERVLDAVRGALRCLTARDRVVVLVHPDDLAAVTDGADELARELGGIEHIDVQQERRVARGDAIVRTAEAEIDARVAAKLEAARRAVESELRA
jgi:flagellar assembly protein FliH